MTIPGAYDEMRGEGPEAELGGWAPEGPKPSSLLRPQALEARVGPNSLCWGGRGGFLKKLDSTAKTNPLLMGSVVY